VPGEGRTTALTFQEGNLGIKATLYTLQKDRKGILAPADNRELEVNPQRLRPSQARETLPVMMVRKGE